MLLSWLMVCLCAGIIILIHETGHYMAARSVGVQPDRFEIGWGPVVWQRGIFVVRLLFPAGGRVNYDDADWERLSLAHRGRIAIGGPAVSILTGLVALPIMPIYGLMSLFCGFGNLIPFPVGDGQSDGGLVFRDTTQIWASRLIFGTLAGVLLVWFLRLLC